MTKCDTTYTFHEIKLFIIKNIKKDGILRIEYLGLKMLKCI